MLRGKRQINTKLSIFCLFPTKSIDLFVLFVCRQFPVWVRGVLHPGLHEREEPSADRGRGHRGLGAGVRRVPRGHQHAAVPQRVGRRLLSHAPHPRSRQLHGRARVRHHRSVSSQSAVMSVHRVSKSYMYMGYFLLTLLRLQENN